MIDLIKKIVGSKVTDNLKKDGAGDVNLATCALLLELAHIDGKFSKQERDNITGIFKTKYGLSEQEVKELIESSESELEKSIDLWKFTNLINQNYTLEEKLKVIETVWEVAYSDGELEKHEDYLVHKVATLLRLSHKQLIDAKLKVLHR
jgi:uncharacterized tellurite resistance protein B-like protein